MELGSWSIIQAPSLLALIPLVVMIVLIFRGKSNVSAIMVGVLVGALLLGLRIPGGQALGTLRTARGYLALSCFIWAAAGFAGTFLHPDVGDKP